MAAIFADADEGLVRTSGFVPASSNYSMCGWFHTAGPPAAGTTQTFFYMGDDPAIFTAVWIGQHETGAIALYAGGASVILGTILTAGWHHIAYVRTGTVHDVYLDGALAATDTVDISSWTFTHGFIGTDRDYPLEWDPGKAAYFREFIVTLTADDFDLESLSAVPIAAGVWTDTPLLDDLLDDSGLGHHWTEDGGTITFGDQPPIPATVVTVWRLDVGVGDEDDLEDDAVDDNGEMYYAALTTKPYAAANVINQHEIKSAVLLAKAAEGVGLAVTIVRDFGATEDSTTVDLSPEDAEAHVIKRLDELSMGELRVAQFTFEDNAVPAGRWNLEQFAVRIVKSEKAS